MASPIPSAAERISPASLSPSMTGVPAPGAGPSIVDRQQALAHEAAIARARGQLLAHVAALVPVDAVQLVETVLEQDRLLDRQVAAAVGHALRDAQAVVSRRRRPWRARAPRSPPARCPRQDRARAEPREPRIDIDDAAVEGLGDAGFGRKPEPAPARRRRTAAPPPQSAETSATVTFERSL